MAELKDCSFCHGSGRVTKNGSRLRTDVPEGGLLATGPTEESLRLPQIPCPACHGVGKVRVSETAVRCGFCHGNGTIKVMVGHVPLAVEPECRSQK